MSRGSPDVSRLLRGGFAHRPRPRAQSLGGLRKAPPETWVNSRIHLGLVGGGPGEFADPPRGGRRRARIHLGWARWPEVSCLDAPRVGGARRCEWWIHLG